MDAIFKRRSIRKFTKNDVSEAQVEKILKAAMSAPSAGNQQPWHFIVIRKPSILKEIPKIHPYSNMLLEAPLAIVVCGDPSLERFKGYWVQDCSAAIQNMLITITDLGLGAVWVGIYPEESADADDFRKLLNIPNSVIPLAVIPIGHPGENKSPADRFNAERIHYDCW
ncbi:nitroreductase family protein [Desulfuribacillus alkaliarsenatis]|uniref:NADH dehydrogenase n=1 Tax=Desulfuribacillus alkaliarsenatis TaxID=766136 RepID=A0A1E5G1G8_9FIRM|nr:nitroreductase family protein [Desulfuribacillus alkaliarsenatis]OEF96672.1 NADH dehydrogenase [Desulfuribacillus alkaliarsenatis]